MVLPKILLVQNNFDQQILIERALKGYEVDWSIKYGDALNKLQEVKYDFVIIDLNTTDRNGFELITHIRKLYFEHDISILAVSAESNLQNKLNVFKLGVDDYMVKPFDLNELRARIDAIVNRKNRNSKVMNFIQVGNLNINLETGCVSLHKGLSSEIVALTSLEFKILLFLAKNKNTFLSREKIRDFAWGDKVNVLSRTVDSKISSIRKKIVPFDGMIKSIHSRGYMLDEEELVSFPASKCG